MTATKTLADLPTLAQRLAEVLSQPPEFGERQPYGGDFGICDAKVGRASIDVGLRAGTDEVTFVSITGEARGQRHAPQVCADAVALVAACCDVDPEYADHQWPTLRNLDMMMAAADVATAWTVLNGVRVDVVGGHGRLDLSCEPA